ncbi:hypothetical protein, partial [Thiolapillus sp.]
EKIACSLHVIALKKGLSELDIADVLKVTVGGGNIARELTSTGLAMGHRVEAVKENSQTVMYVQKKGD